MFTTWMKLIKCPGLGYLNVSCDCVSIDIQDCLFDLVSTDFFLDENFCTIQYTVWTVDRHLVKWIVKDKDTVLKTFQSINHKYSQPN